MMTFCNVGIVLHHEILSERAERPDGICGRLKAIYGHEVMK
jgi:hypothetical protein